MAFLSLHAFFVKGLVMEKTRYIPRWVLVTAVIAAVLAVAFLLQPDNQDGALHSVPKDSIVVGVHRNIRDTWRKQFESPVVSKFLSGYGLEAKDLAKESGVYWTFRIAVGDMLVSSLLPDNAENGYILCAASPMKRRAFLIRFFMAINWVPGLGRLSSLEDGTRYVDIASKKASKPQILSLAIKDNLLLAKLYDKPLGFTDMCTSKEVLQSDIGDIESKTAHSFIVKNPYLRKLGFAADGGNAVCSVSFPDEDLCVRVELPLSKEEVELCGSLFDYSLSGRNAIASSLAADHAIALVLLPSHFVSPIAQEYLACEKGVLSDDDAVLYINRSPYGAKLFAFDVPAITAIIPNLNISDDAMKAALSRDIPKMLRPFFALHGGNTICTAMESLRAQRKAQPVNGKAWKDFYGELAKASNLCAFAYFNIDPLSLELRQVVSAVQMLSSFGAVKLSKDEKKKLSQVSKVLPIIPTGCTLSFGVNSPKQGSSTLEAVFRVSQR